MKYIRPARGASLQSTGRRTRRRFGVLRARRRGVSEVVATIILLAMTVVLFGSIFAWVTSFPTPAPQNVTQFSANFVLTTSGNAVAGLQITHLAGPSVPGSTQVYLKSAYHPSAPEFANPITAAAYLPNPNVWNLGQTFNYSFPLAEQPVLPDNITILLVANGQLIYSTILPGTTIAVPPNFVATGISPANPAVGAAFTVTAVVSGNTGGATVYVTLSNIPGLSGAYPHAVAMTYSGATNRWTFVVPSGHTNANGTYYAFVNVTNSLGQAATAGVAVTLVSSGGSGSSATLSVAVLMTPQPPTLPQTSSYFAAVVTYLGSGQNLALSVEFWANQTPGSVGMPHPWATLSQSFTALSNLQISGPSTETVYSTPQPSFSNWVFNSSVLVSAAGTVATVGSAAGSTSFSTANLAQGIVQTNPKIATLSHSCSGSACPFLNDTVWNNWTTAFTFQGTIYVNTTGGANKNTYTITNQTVAVGGHTTVSGPGATTRWKPSTNYGNVIVVTILRVWVGTTIVGYIYDTYSPLNVT
ncbi:MAG TPA: type IV pilin [Thermoplasmata archaeon]|nr:type IV pilin [Thermoplasmata archaeon]